MYTSIATRVSHNIVRGQTKKKSKQIAQRSRILDEFLRTLDCRGVKEKLGAFTSIPNNGKAKNIYSYIYILFQ